MEALKSVVEMHSPLSLEALSTTPLVSAIIIFLNAGKFIRESIGSVFDQTYKNWELLLVDDGSTDLSTGFALQYARQYAGKVRYFEHEGHKNMGMSASRNLGINNSQGKYIALLDADDVWLPHKLEQQIKILESQPETAMVYGPTQVWYSWDPESTRCDYIQNIGVQQNTLVRPPTVINYFLRNDFITPILGAALIRREVFEKVGKYEDNFHGFHEDQVFLKIPL